MTRFRRFQAAHKNILNRFGTGRLRINAQLKKAVVLLLLFRTFFHCFRARFMRVDDSVGVRNRVECNQRRAQRDRSADCRRRRDADAFEGIAKDGILRANAVHHAFHAEQRIDAQSNPAAKYNARRRRAKYRRARRKRAGAQQS